MISDKHQSIFVHIPKTGGTSITKAFGQIEHSRHGVQDHRTVQELRRAIPQQQFDAYFKFAFVRNTWSRIASWYKNVIQDPVHRDNFGIDQDCSFREFLLEHGSIWGLQSQLHWLRDENGEIPLDFIGRFENLEEHFRLICERVGLSSIDLPHLVKAHDSRPYTMFYDDETRDIVASRYAEEIEMFGYQFAPKSSHRVPASPVDPKVCSDLTSDAIKIDYLARRIWNERPTWVAKGTLAPSSSHFLLETAFRAPSYVTVEIGTGSGFSATVLCHALNLANRQQRMSNDYRITSYDISRKCLFDQARLVGDAAREQLPADMLNHLRFRNPGTAADFGHFHSLNEIGFLFIDANHKHPWPTLDLLAALPYLAVGATVVLHDINGPTLRPGSGDRGVMELYCDLDCPKQVPDDVAIPNIGSFQIPEDKAAFEAQLRRILYAHEWQAEIGDHYLARLNVARPNAQRSEQSAPAAT